ncbi:TPA: fimbria/pilus outer membrane usher protein [Klebsiella pneumoniae]
MTHRARDNVPSALWDEGISAFQSNYRYSGASQRTREGSTERDNYLMLKSGVNVGAWRLRASNSLTANSDDKPQWTTSGAWLERDLTRWQSELTLGDTFTSGDVFDAVQFQGISLASSDAMLPDSQKGFAPTIRGIARTNAQVTVRQNGYVLYQTYVTPGAFVIDDLYPTASSGNLEVAVKESDGEIRRFTQPYASVTSMQREGSLKYNLVAGRYHSDDTSQRPLMMQLSLMRGFAHNLTLFGGLQSAAQYHNLSLGAGQGLGEAGALSLQLLNARDRHQQDPIDGRAWQLQYSKGFDRLGTQFTFTGWRYSHQRYATLSEAFSSPGSDDDLQIPEARDWITSIVAEVVQNYPIDGVQFDDYFYTETASSPLNDNETFRRYGQGYASKGDWRRHNTQQLIAQVSTTIKKLNPNVEFGVSPAGVWRNRSHDPAGSDTRGAAAYDESYADTRSWVQQGLLDYIAPQIYWPFARDAARYDVLANWWAEVVKPTHTRLYIGVALYKVGEPSKNEPDWTVDGGVPELKKQLDLNETLPQIQGTILFRENNLNQPQTRQAVNYLRSRWGQPQS